MKYIETNYPLYSDYMKYFETNYPLYSDYIKYFETNYPLYSDYMKLFENILTTIFRVHEVLPKKNIMHYISII